MTRDELCENLVVLFRQHDELVAKEVRAGKQDPRHALVLFSRVRAFWESIYPGLGERMIPVQTEQAALDLVKRKEGKP